MKERTLKIGQKVALVLDGDDYIADAVITGFDEQDGDTLTTSNPKDVVSIKITDPDKEKTHLTTGNEVTVNNIYLYAFTNKKFHGEPACTEHMETEEDYPYFCPALMENCFEIELD